MRGLLPVLLAAAPASAAVVSMPVSLPAPVSAPAAAAAALSPLSAAPALTAVPAALLPVAAPAALVAAPLAAPSVAAPAAAQAAPAPALALAAPAALAAGPSAAPADGPRSASPESAAADAARLFDGLRAAPDAGAVPDAPRPGWTRGTFASADGAPIAYERRGPAAGVPRVFAGGLALNESFDALFARPGEPARPEYFSWTRGHRPSGWVPTPSVLDADARDLARLIATAARESGSAKVELVAHSFGAVVFQRMVQLRAEPEVRAALKALAGSRVVLLNGMTHYDHVEELGGPSVVLMAKMTTGVVDWLDAWDRAASYWELASRNPLLAVQAAAWLMAYRAQRAELIDTAVREAAKAMRRDLLKPWPSRDGIRRGFLQALDSQERDAAWKESLLRRSAASFRLDFKTSDAAVLRRLKTRVEMVHSLGDELLNWQAARLLFGRFGVETPELAPAAGTTLRDRSGRFTGTVVAADHYYPLKDADALARRLGP